MFYAVVSNTDCASLSLCTCISDPRNKKKPLATFLPCAAVKMAYAREFPICGNPAAITCKTLMIPVPDVPCMLLSLKDHEAGGHGSESVTGVCPPRSLEPTP